MEAYYLWFIVKSIKTSDETGTTVTVDIGNGYEAIYGQLKNLNVVLLNARYFINNNNELLKSFKNINNDLTELENREHVNLKLSTDGLYGYIYNLNDRNINYNIVKKIDEKKIKYIYSWRMEVEQE